MALRKRRNRRAQDSTTANVGRASLNGPPFGELVALLQSEAKVSASIDEPADPNGPWWLDVTVDDHLSTVVWRHDQGLGLFITDSVFGEHPDGIFRDVRLAAARLLQLAAQRNHDRQDCPLSLRDLRHLIGRNQQELAEKLNKAQSAISKLEKGTDPKLSTLDEYIEAMGGRLVISVEFPEFEAPIQVSHKAVSHAA